MRRRKVITLSIPVRLLLDIDKLAKQEQRTRSALIRDALQFYFDLQKDKGLCSAVRDRATALQIETEDDIERIVDEVRK